MGFHQMPGNGQPQAHSAGSPGPGLVYSIKPVKNVGQVCRRYTRSGIFNGYLGLPVALADTDSYLSVGRRMGYGIYQKIAQHLDDTLRVGLDQQLRGWFHRQNDALGLDLRLDQGGGVVGQVARVAGLEPQLHLS
jgi:hypothetical protein